MVEIVKLVVVGIVMALFILFLALFAVHEDDLLGKGQQDQNFSGATGNMELPLIENIVSPHDPLDMVTKLLNKESILILSN